jgi:hypothetical protein
LKREKARAIENGIRNRETGAGKLEVFLSLLLEKLKKILPYDDEKQRTITHHENADRNFIRG